MRAVRRTIRNTALELIGQRPARAGAPPADGLFPPSSIVRHVHGDFTSMMIGGTGALLLQMLHPGALAAVWDHTEFRTGMDARLKRTAQFISVTTYGSRAQAEAAIARVNAIHAGVGGTLPDGMPYAANDPALIAWVHVAEVSCFLKAYRRYRDPWLAPAAQDRYFAETATIAARLGGNEVPTTRRAVRDYLEDMRPPLKADARTREVARILLAQRAPNLAMAPFYGVLFDAAIDILPLWAERMHGLTLPLHRRPAIRAGALGMGAGMRWAMGAT